MSPVWGALVTMIGKLSGYHERLEVANSHVVALAQLSDAELMGRLQDSLERLGIDPQSFRLLRAERSRRSSTQQATAPGTT